MMLRRQYFWCTPPYMLPMTDLKSPLCPSSIRIGRSSSTPSLPQISIDDARIVRRSESRQQAGGPRSSSSPQLMHWSTVPFNPLPVHRTGNFPMPSVREEASRPAGASLQLPHESGTKPGRLRGATTSALSGHGLGRRGRLVRSQTCGTSEYEPTVVELLDVVGLWTPMCLHMICDS